MSKLMIALALLLPMAPPQEKTFTVGGTLKFDGEPPKPKVNKALLGDPACAACHKEDPAKDDLVIDASGGVRWAFVYVKKGLEGKTFEPPAEAVQLDQAGCTYTPHMVGVRVGQPLTLRNSDPMAHNVHGLPFSNREFNICQQAGGSSIVKFTTPEVPVRVKCDIHPWMGAWVAVVDHPFYAVTDATGKFEIKNLPPGKYTLGVWHEKLKTNDQEIEVKEDLKVEFKLQ
jgi:plastocyanin